LSACLIDHGEDAMWLLLDHVQDRLVVDVGHLLVPGSITPVLVLCL
jgi:hypothetical protein